MLMMHRIDYSVSGLLSFKALQRKFVEQSVGRAQGRQLSTELQICNLELEVSSSHDPGSDNLQTDGMEV